MVYYGILKEEDAQCFRVEARIENASYYLAAASVALALVNTFVMRGVNQYFRDVDASAKEFKAVIGTDGEEIEDLPQAIQRIQPVPVLFTDAFRWFLVREHTGPDRRVCIAEDGKKIGISEIREDIPEDPKQMVENGMDLMADTMEVENLEPSPLEGIEYDDIEDYDEEYEVEYYDDKRYPYSYCNEILTSSPRPRQPEPLHPSDDSMSREAVQDNNSNGAYNSIETPYQAGGENTVLSAISELTEPQTEPWRDV